MRTLLQKALARIPALLGERELRVLDTAIHRLLFSKYQDVGEEHFAYWERRVRDWHRMVPPIRPSQEELGIYETLLSDGPPPKRVLVLGSTPELRDLLAERFDADVYVADQSFSMIVSMLRLTEHVDPHAERWVRDTWLELAFPDGYFDHILGDVVLHQLTPVHERAFLEKMSRLLAPGGRFITRLFFLDEEFLNTEMATYVDQILNGQGTDAEKSMLLRLIAVWKSTDLKRRTFDRARGLDEFRDAVRGRANDAVLSEVDRVLVRDLDSYRTWSPPSREDLTALIQSTFDQKAERVAADYPVSRFFPVVTLGTRSRTYVDI